MHIDHISAAIQINEPICAVYSTLLLKDFSLVELELSLAKGWMQPEITAIDMKIFEHFYQGLRTDRLQLKGSYDDLAGWLLVHIEAYVDPQEPDTPFQLIDWECLTPDQRADVAGDAERLGPLLADALAEAFHISYMQKSHATSQSCCVTRLPSASKFLAELGFHCFGFHRSRRALVE